MTFLFRIFSISITTLLLGLGASMAAAQEGDDQSVFQLELNAAAETTTGNCRLTYVASNGSDIALSRTAYEVAIFDTSGVVTRLLVLEFGELIEGKTKILQFDLADTPCGSVSRIVVNDVAACTRSDTGEEADICLSGLAASSRTAIQFGI